MAEENKNYMEMWNMLAKPGEEWEYHPDAKLLANNVYFHSLMAAVNNLSKAVGDFSLTEEEKVEAIKNMRSNLKSASWVSALYGALDVPEEGEIDLSGSKD